LKTKAYFYYFFSAIFLLARIFQNLGGEFNFLAFLVPLFFILWFSLVIAGLFKYRKLPLLVLFLVPFFAHLIRPYTEKAIFYRIQLPFFQQALKDIEKTEYGPNTDPKKIQILENVKTPFTFWIVRSKVPNTNISIIRFAVGSTGGLGTHWGYVYCSDENTNVDKIPDFADKVTKINGNWYFWDF
jgi:hypothetical protein